MIRTLILLSPVYVSLFWFVSLQSNRKKECVPSRMLSYFLLIAAISFFGQYLFFAPYPDIFPYWEPLLALFGGIAFPIYYIYFRLLTVDEKFTLRKHAKFLIVPLLIAIVYTAGILFTPFEQYKAWLYNDSLYPDSPQIQFLGVMRQIIKLTFLGLLVITYFLNRSLLRKYADKAEQYYSDIQDGRNNNAKRINYFLLIMTVSTFIAHIVGRQMLLPSDVIIGSIWIIFSISIYGIGYMGFTQKAINPTYEAQTNLPQIIISELEDENLNFSQQVILKKLVDAFEQEKIFLKSNLNIMDVVQRVGTNRSYISALINKQYNQNFCAFVNWYRMRELERLIEYNPAISNEQLIEKSGFGSFNSMKRTIETSTGLSIQVWKNKFGKMAV